MDQGIFLSVDFSKAYESVFHSYLEAFFYYIALPPMMTALLISIFKAQGGRLPTVLMRPPQLSVKTRGGGGGGSWGGGGVQPGGSGGGCSCHGSGGGLAGGRGGGCSCRGSGGVWPGVRGASSQG